MVLDVVCTYRRQQGREKVEYGESLFSGIMYAYLRIVRKSSRESDPELVGGGLGASNSYCPLIVDRSALSAQRSTINVSHVLLLRIPNADLLRPSIRYFEIFNMMSSIASVMWKVSKRGLPVNPLLSHPNPFL
jgi:hypothetical protein